MSKNPKGPVESVVADASTVTPDLFAGELDSVGRILHDMAGRLARHALHVQDLQLAAKHAADELRALSAQLESPEEADQRDRLFTLSHELSKTVERLDERPEAHS
jgi:hypothetical protein